MDTLSYKDFEKRLRVVFSEKQIHEALDRLVQQLNREYQTAFHDEEKAPVMVPVMNGAMVFAAALMQRISFPIMLECIQLTRTRHEAHDPISGISSLVSAVAGEVFSAQWLKKATVEHIAGKRVLLIDAVLDHGVTLAEAQKGLLEQGAEDVKVVVLIEKWADIQKPCVPDYCLFSVPDGDFVLGFGMDGYGWGRNFNAIMAFDE